MHSPPNTLDNQLVIRKFLTTEEIMTRFPHVVNHDASFTSSKWYSMRYWLNLHVGAHDVTWSWLVSSEIRFVHEYDALQFSLTWS
jgi:hypothetical protein